MTTPPPSLHAMLTALIAAPSMSSVSPEYDTSNRAVIDLLAAWLTGMGFQVEVLPLPHQPHKANLIATLGQGPGGLVLAGHTDTVPYDEGRWQHDPFRLVEADNRYYGLGTADMKGFFAVVIDTVRDLRAADLQQPLIILATADEESSMEGAQALVALGRPRARYAVIGEPTGLRPINAHKGIIMEGIRLSGRSGHSSDPSLGNSALEGMHKVIGELLAWRAELQTRNVDRRFAVPVPTLNLGHIHGGDNPNRICGQCELHIDLRLLPGMELEDLRHTLQRRVGASIAGSGLQLDIRHLGTGTPPLHTPADSPLVHAAEQLTGYGSETVAFCTEGPYLNQLGMHTVILGPGNIAQAHQPDEYLGLERIAPMQEIIRGLVGRFCLET